MSKLVPSFIYLKCTIRDFPSHPVVKNPPSSAGDMGLIPGQGTNTPHAKGQLGPCATTTERTPSRARAPQLESPRAVTTDPTHPGACAPELEGPRVSVKESACRNEDPVCHN